MENGSAPLQQQNLDDFSLEKLPPPTLTEQLVFDDILGSAPLDRHSAKKNVELLHMIPQKGKVLLQLRKTWLVLHDYAIKQGLMEPAGSRRRFRVLAKQLFADIGYDSNDYEAIKSTLRTGISTVVDWGPSAKGRAGEESLWEATALLSDVRFITVGKRLYIDWSYSDVLVAQLQRAGPWFCLSMKALRSARTTGGLNLYMLCERYRTNHGGLSSRMEPAAAHALLNGLPVPPPGTPLGRPFKYWKRDTVDKWKAEVNSYEGLPFTVEMKEHYGPGRRVAAVQFIVKDKPEAESAATISAVREAYIARLVRCGINRTRAKRFVSEHSDAAIATATPYLERALANPNPTKPIRNVAGWFAGMLERAVQGELQPLEIDAPEAVADAPSAPAGPQSLNDVLVRARDDFLKSADGAKAYFMSLDEPTRAAVTDEFVAEMRAGPNWEWQMRKPFDRQGLASPLVASRLWTWLMARGFEYEPTAEQLTLHAFNKGFLVPKAQ